MGLAWGALVTQVFSCIAHNTEAAAMSTMKLPACATDSPGKLRMTLNSWCMQGKVGAKELRAGTQALPAKQERDEVLVKRVVQSRDPQKKAQIGFKPNEGHSVRNVVMAKKPPLNH